MFLKDTNIGGVLPTELLCELVCSVAQALVFLFILAFK